MSIKLILEIYSCFCNFAFVMKYIIPLLILCSTLASAYRSYRDLLDCSDTYHAASAKKDAALGSLLNGNDDAQTFDRYTHFERAELHQQLQMVEAAASLNRNINEIENETALWIDNGVGL